SSGTEKMRELSLFIHKGALAFLHKEYQVLTVFVIIVALVLYFFIGKNIMIAFIIGAIFSALAGNIGMRIATLANARTAEAAKKSLNNGLKVAFSSGSVMGLTVVGLGLAGVTVLYLIFKDPNIIYGFGFGASSTALFARVGGGIYTKAADVGADLVGKVEKGIPEDDPRNPAVIADQVGDNVGDIAGMGADLFESYVDSIIAAMVLGLIVLSAKGIILPLGLAAVGILSSIIGIFFVKVTKKTNLYWAMNKGIFVSSVLMMIGSYFLIRYIADINLFYSTLTGLITGIVIGLSTEHYTSREGKPVKTIAEAAKTGAGTNIIQGLSVGMFSTIIPVLVVCVAIYLSYHFSGPYGIAIAAVGMLSTLGITLASDCYGPVADNSAGIAEMAKMGKKVRKRCESLDAVGNTTAAIGKGFAIGSAALTALALFASYTQVVSQLTGTKVIIDITMPTVMIGLFIGALLPFLFSALTMKAVGVVAEHVINEVRRQFK
ncbi:MAG: sodium-translocating pyrophosphatase, partial [Nanoarchaeota archaeon]|nr:sodium-translocating pyrophosphatase [Nanoarchaeota archaeon]